ncbi:MAG: metallophosphoesterase [Lachnospiraceae bacterium]|nr:metallophosphoesterase [Lachnospiraceae bacterium]
MTALIIIVILAVFFLTVMIIDGNRFRVVEYQLYSSKVKKEHRYVVLSDLHNKSYGEKNSRLIRKIIGLTPEGILIAGDILTAKPGKSYEVALDLIKNLAEKYPIYYGMGNHETRLFLYPETYGDMGERYLADLNKVSVDFLKNESQQCEDNIRITGLDMDRNYYKRLKKYPMDSNYLKETLGEADKQKYEVLLAHNPDYFEEYAEWGADLVLSGHVHGGMMRLPVLGGVISPSVKLFPKYDGGIFKIGKSTMILSRGLGMHTIPIRIFNPGELILLKISPESE